MKYVWGKVQNEKKIKKWNMFHFFIFILFCTFPLLFFIIFVRPPTPNIGNSPARAPQWWGLQFWAGSSQEIFQLWEKTSEEICKKIIRD